MADEPEDSFQQFKFEILGDAVYEDFQGLWEPLWYANHKFADLAQAEREALAERALRELLEEELIYFVDFGPETRIPSSEPAPLNMSEAQAAIAGDSWRGLPPREARIFFGGTMVGERAARKSSP